MRTRFMALAFGVLFAFGALAQAPHTYKVRLSPVAMDAGMRNTVAGQGSATATLTGSKLTINGTFEGLKSNATMAHIHHGVAAGVHGPKILDLTVTQATNGNISGSFDLTPEQLEDLKKNKLYIQIHSEKAPEGNLWGWLMN